MSRNPNEIRIILHVISDDKIFNKSELYFFYTAKGVEIKFDLSLPTTIS